MGGVGHHGRDHDCRQNGGLASRRKILAFDSKTGMASLRQMRSQLVGVARYPCNQVNAIWPRASV